MAGVNYFFAALPRLGAHRIVSATKEATARHPYRDTNGEQQSHHFVREKVHRALGVYLRANIFVEQLNADERGFADNFLRIVNTL